MAEDTYDDPEYRDPIDSASATLLLNHAMKQEEQALTQPPTPPVMVQNPQRIYAPEDLSHMPSQTQNMMVTMPPSPQAWQDALSKNPVGGQQYLDTQSKALQSLAMMEWNKKVAQVGIQAAGPPPNLKAPASFWKPQPQPAQMEETKYGGRNFLKVTQPNGTIVLHPTDKKESLDTITETIPATDAKPGTPAVPARATTRVLGIPVFPGRDAQPEVPAVPAQSARKITRRVPAGTSDSVVAPPPQPKKPTRSVARDYIQKYGNDAKKQLLSDGYDITGYAD